MKKILILVPHPDDEINLAGYMIIENIKKNNDVFVVYSTNGDYKINPKERIREALKSCQKLGVKKENIYFLGYADQSEKETDHLIFYDEHNFWTSKHGKKETYCVNNNHDFRYIKNLSHSLYNYKNFYDDIYDIVVDIFPDEIFCIDLDSHPDHRALSLTFEQVIGSILKDNKGYMPIIYKGFAYDYCFYGEKDLFSININETIDNYPKKLGNPYYIWEQRIRFYNNNNTRLLVNNKIFKALKQHKIPIALKHCESIINSDSIFWQRRTDSISYSSNIEVSSGNSKFLNDFIIYNPTIIGNKKKYDSISWCPANSDLEKTISFEFDEEKYVFEIKIYEDMDKNSSIEEILVNDNKIKLNNKVNNISIIKLDNIYKKVVIKILKFDSVIAINEIEIFQTNHFNYNDASAILLDDNILPKYYLSEGKYKIGLYNEKAKKGILVKRYKNKKIKLDDNNLIINKGDNFFLESDNINCDSVHIIYLNKFLHFCFIFINYFNKIYLLFIIFIQKIKRKFLLKFSKSLHNYLKNT